MERYAEDLDRFIKDVQPERIRVSDFVIDPLYQRDIVNARVKTIRATFERHALGAFIASRRADGKPYLLDGQQRREALILMGFGELLVWALVIEGLTENEESTIFDILNFGRTGVTPHRRFINAINRGDLRQTKILALVQSCGWVIPLKSAGKAGAGVLTCVKALEDSYDNALRCDRLDAFRHGLEVAYLVYQHETAATQGVFIKGIYAFCRDFWGKYDEKRLLDVLAKMTAQTLLRQAKPDTSGRPGIGGIVVFLMNAYNSGLRKNQRLGLNQDESDQ